MKTLEEKGMTIAGYLWNRWFGGSKQDEVGAAQAPSPPRPEADFYNPLRLALEGYVQIDVSPYYGKDLQVWGIAEFTRTIGGKTLKSTDYILNKDGDDGLWVTLRARPGKYGKGVECIIFAGHDEIDFSEDAKAALEGQELVDNKTGLHYKRGGAHDVTLREVTLEKRTINTAPLKYWDFTRMNEQGKPELYMVEQDQDTGMYEVSLGTSCTAEDVRLIAGHTSAAA